MLSDVGDAGLSLLLSALVLAGSAVAFIIALGLAPVANVLIMFGATPFITALLARLFLRRAAAPPHDVRHGRGAGRPRAQRREARCGAGAALGMAVAGIVVLCMSFNYVIVRHRRDVGMQPSLALAGVISALIALPFAASRQRLGRATCRGCWRSDRARWRWACCSIWPA